MTAAFPGDSTAGADISSSSMGSAQFTHHIKNQSLPVSHVEVRHETDLDVQVSLVSHLPSDGIWFDAIDDLVISVVIKSDHSPVVRDLGVGPSHFLERPGCILITPPETSSYWSFRGNPLVLHLSVPRRCLHEFARKSGSGLQADLAQASRQPIYDQLISQLTSRLWAWMRTGEQNLSAFGHHAIGAIISVIIQNGQDAARFQLGAPAAANGAMAPWRLRRVMTYMAERLHEMPPITELARVVDLSPDHFSRSFTAATGITPYQWHTNLKIEEAKRLLTETTATMTEIAHDLGFSSSAHFATRFKKFVGFTPRDWRSGFAKQSGYPIDYTM